MNKKKRTLFEVLRAKFVEKPATPEEIRQLKLNAERAELQAKIAEAKKRKGSKLKTLFSTLAEPTKAPDDDKLKGLTG